MWKYWLFIVHIPFKYIMQKKLAVGTLCVQIKHMQKFNESASNLKISLNHADVEKKIHE